MMVCPAFSDKEGEGRATSVRPKAAPRPEPAGRQDAAVLRTEPGRAQAQGAPAQ